MAGEGEVWGAAFGSAFATSSATGEERTLGAQEAAEEAVLAWRDRPRPREKTAEVDDSFEWDSW